MPTYDLIASNTLSSATNSVTFSSIPSTFNDLVFLCNWKGDSAANLYLRFNGDSSANYGYGSYGSYSSGNTVYGFGGSGGTFISSITVTGASANNIWTGTTLHINEYKNTSVWKSCLSRSGSSNETSLGCGTWSSTAAINSIEVFSNGTNYSVGSIFSLYGIKAA